MLCDKSLPKKLKLLIYKAVIYPALLYGNETWSLTEHSANKISTCEMVRYCFQISLEEHCRNDGIRIEVNVMPVKDLMKRKRLG